MLACASMAGRFLHHVLCDIKNRHDEVKGMIDNENGDPSLEHPLDEHPCVDVVHIVLVNDHTDKLIAEDRRNDQSGNRQDRRLGQTADDGENAGVPCLRRFSHFARDLGNAGVHAIKHTRQIPLNGFDQEFLDPFIDRVEYEIHRRSPFTQ